MNSEQDRHYERQQLLEMGWTSGALTHLGQPHVEERRGRHGDYVVHSWARATVEHALRTALMRAWRTKREAALKALGKKFLTPAAYERKLKGGRSRAERAQKRMEKQRAKAETRKVRQLARVAKLKDEQSLELAPLALHAENRRAKHEPWNRDRIYSLKNRYLVALLRAGQGQLLSFVHEQDEPTGIVGCLSCGHVWDGWRSGECFCCRRGIGVPDARPELVTWYLVEVGGHRFHQPSRFLPVDLRGLASPTDSHDPTQPPRDIPQVKLGRDVLMPEVLQAIITRATAVLEATQVLPGDPPASRTPKGGQPFPSELSLRNHAVATGTVIEWS